MPVSLSTLPPSASLPFAIKYDVRNVQVFAKVPWQINEIKLLKRADTQEDCSLYNSRIGCIKMTLWREGKNAKRSKKSRNSSAHSDNSNAMPRLLFCCEFRNRITKEMGWERIK